MTSVAVSRGTTRVLQRTESISSPRAGAVWAVTILVLWGVASFGAVYPWTRIPLLLGASVSAMLMARDVRRQDTYAAVLMGAVICSAALQAVSIPSVVRNVLTPRDAFLNRYAVASPDVQAWQPISIARADTIDAISRAAVYAFLCVALAAWLRRDDRVVKTLARNILFIAAAIGVEAILQKGAFNGKIYWFWESSAHGTSNYFGPFVNRNHFAGWMVLAASLAAGWMLAQASQAASNLKPGWRNRTLWLSTPQAARIILASAGLLAMIVSLIWTMSRSGIAGGAIAMFVIAVAAALNMKGVGRRLLVPSVLFVLFVAAIATKGADKLASWYATTDTLQWRFDQWHDAMAPLRDFWLTGSGLNTYGMLTLIYPQTDTTVHAAQAHNDYLQLAVEGGLLVGIPVLIAIGALIRTIARRLRQPQDERTWWIRLGAVAGICGIAVQEITDFSLQIPGVALLFAVVVAIAIHEPAPVAIKHDRLSRVRV